MLKRKKLITLWLLAIFVLLQVVRLLNRSEDESAAVLTTETHVLKTESSANWTFETLVSPVLSRDEKSKRLLVLVTTHPKNFKERQAIRNTWASHNVNISVFFQLGVANNETLMDSVYAEAAKFNDIIVKNFTDIYDNLTKKTLSMLEWILENAMRNDYFLKTDDDNFINMPYLLDFIRTQNVSRKQIFGYKARNWRPVRNKTSKYYLSVADYKPKKLPDFVTGPAYLMTLVTVRDLYDEALRHNIIRLEDVFLTGIIAQKLNIPRHTHVRFTNKFYNGVPGNVCFYFNIHRVIALLQNHYYGLSKKCTIDSRNISAIVPPNKNVAAKKTTTLSASSSSSAAAAAAAAAVAKIPKQKPSTSVKAKH